MRDSFHENGTFVTPVVVAAMRPWLPLRGSSRKHKIHEETILWWLRPLLCSWGWRDRKSWHFHPHLYL